MLEHLSYTVSYVSVLGAQLTSDALILEPLSYLTRLATTSRSTPERFGSKTDQSCVGYS